jgi:hypothetical protein
MNQFFTVVLKRPADAQALQQYTLAIEATKPFQTTAALGDAISLLDHIEEHEDFDSRIADDARNALGMHGC